MSAKKLFSGIVGNSPTLGFLAGQLAAPFHAYLFLGPEGVGKKTSAKYFAEGLLGSGITHSPDYYELNNLADLTSSQARSEIAATARKPLSSNYTIVVIDQLEQLELEVHNALLKSLEEPGSQRIFLLIAHSRNLPQTLMSRCRTVNFNQLSTTELEQFANNKGFNFSTDELALAGGSPGVLQDWYEHPEKLTELKTEIQNLEQAQSLYEKTLLITRLANLEGPFLKSVFLSWLHLNKLKLASQPQRFLQLKRLSEAFNDLSAGFNIKLTISRILIG